jgi:hypothetical protein
MNKTGSDKFISDSRKKDNSTIKKLVVLLALTAALYLAFQYYKYYQARNLAGQNVEKNDATENDLFEVSGEYKGEDYDLSDLTISEMREKGAEFIYQILLKNQLQIEGLKNDLKTVNQELLRYKNNQKITTAVLTYVQLRDNFFAEKNYAKNLENFEILTQGDKNLKTLTDDLKNNLAKFSSKEKLRQSFKNLIPELIAIKHHGSEDDFVANIRRNFSKLIVIRNSKNKVGNDIEAVILRVEGYLKEENYNQSALELTLVDAKYQAALKDFVESLKVAIEVNRIDGEILNYLEKIS